jgi:GNAT superfamily N-acetyltransferase
MAIKLRPIVAKNGQTLPVRFLTPEDGDLLVDLVQRLSRETRYQRFHASAEQVPMEEIQRQLPSYLDVDGVNSAALMALVREEGEERAIAVARFRRRPGQKEAEAAVVVRDDWHRQGIGSQLMLQLMNAARSVGIERFTAMIQTGNRAVHAMISAVGVPYDSHMDRGEDYIVLHLEEMPR